PTRTIPPHACPPCDQTAEPNGLLGRFHFTSSAISGSASWTIFRRFASVAPRQSRVFAINSSTGPARLMSAPHSLVYRVSAIPAAHGTDVIASRRAALDARVASDELLARARDGNHDVDRRQLVSHAHAGQRGRIRFSNSPGKRALCRGPESNWRHMVLQVMSLAICKCAPERKHGDTAGSVRAHYLTPPRIAFHEIGHAYQMSFCARSRSVGMMAKVPG